MDLELRILKHRIEDQIRDSEYLELADDVLALGAGVLRALHGLDQAARGNGLTSEAAANLADDVRHLVAVVL